MYQAGCSLSRSVLSRIQNERITPEETRVQDEVKARYWDPIPEEKMQQVLKKISEQKYRYQNGE